MGCGLRKLKPVSEESSPGKIYSTLKRPQVETKVGVAYTYRYLDFLIGKDDGTSTLRLSSVRELPSQLHDLYQQGFILAAVHPFIHPCGPESNSPQHQLYRAILVRLNDGVERSQQPCPPHRLHLEECLPGDQVPTPELIQGYVKKQVQDAADQGVRFVGFVQEPYGAPCTRIREPETPSLSLHSSPSSVLGSLGSCSPPEPSSPRSHGGGPGVILEEVMPDAEGPESGAAAKGPQSDGEGDDLTENTGNDGAGSGGEGGSLDHSCSSPDQEQHTEEKEEVKEEEKESLVQNNNRTNAGDAKGRPRYMRNRRGDGVELLALFNQPPVREGQAKYYTVKVPLKVQNRDEGVKGVEANWLDHMTQHFNNGASLVDGYFHLGGDNDLLPMSVESVFIFQEASEGEPSAPVPAYDAIVVEQWTVIDGLQVKADYVPLLQSLATYGWRLTCVLPTPVIKTKSDGSLSTKQIVFLQRPVLSRKKREPKKLIFKSRSKTNKKCMKEATSAKNKKKNKAGAATEEKALEDPKILEEDGDKKVTWADANQDGGAGTTEEPDQERETGAGKGEEEEEGGRMDDEVKVSVEKTGKREDGGDVEMEHKEGRENGKEEEEEEEKMEAEKEENKETLQDSGEAHRNEEPLENGEVPSDVENANKRAADRHERAVEAVVVVNGLQEEKETDDGYVELTTKQPETTEGATTREPLAEAKPTNQSPEGAQQTVPGSQ